MRFFHIGKDGGPESTVTGYWLVEIKKLFSIALLRFSDGSRDEYHTHAFNCVSWVLSGFLEEQPLGDIRRCHYPSWLPVVTKRETFHRVISRGTTWVFTIRGPWMDKWNEYNPNTKKYKTLKNGRIEVS